MILPLPDHFLSANDNMAIAANDNTPFVAVKVAA
jgi:hypothetical protein